MSESTIFSQIIRGDIPCTKIYEDDHVLAFLDISPIQPGHTLVIPKTFSSDIRDTEIDTLTRVMEVAQLIAKAQTKALGCDGVNISMNCGEAAGQEVFHTHVHVIPRYLEDGVMPEIIRGEYEENEVLAVAEDIRSAL